MTETKTITKQKRLEAFAFYTLAGQHYMQCREFERALAKALGSEEEFHGDFADALYATDKPPPFDEVLARAGYTVVEDGNG